MAELKRRAGRPRKHVGLAPPAELRRLVDGSEMRDLQGSVEKSEKPILPSPPVPAATKVGEGRIFGAARSEDNQRRPETLSASVLDSPGRPSGDSAELTFSNLLKKIALEEAAPLYQERDTRMSNLEVLARRVFDEALKTTMGSQRARELIVERLEGKAVRGERVQAPETLLEDQLDKTEAELINSLTRKAQNVSIGQDSDRADQQHSG